MPDKLKQAYDCITRARNLLLAEHQERHFSEPVDAVSSVLTDCGGYVTGSGIAILEIGEALPHNKELTSVVNDHWLGCVQAAIGKLTEKSPLPRFDMAMAGFCIAMPRGVNNARIWDASNRAMNLIINNLKGVFFPDDDIEHMAFAVLGCWADEPKTTIYIGDFHTQGGEIMALLDAQLDPNCSADGKPWRLVSG